jgi:hypothetical protein
VIDDAFNDSVTDVNTHSRLITKRVCFHRKKEEANMRNRLAVVLGVAFVLSLATNVWSQPNATVDTPFQIRYVAGLNVGDSFVNITNGGARGAAIEDGTGASVTGAICANVYVFSPDEQMIACCSAPVTPNGLISFSARRDLISNTLTPAVPTSIVVKILGSTPVGGSCNGSAAAPGALTSGLLAWGTSVHGQTTTETITTPNTSDYCKTYCSPGNEWFPSYCKKACKPVISTITKSFGSTTETPFGPATLSAGESVRLTDLCTFIVSAGSGYGICRSGQLGGQ